MMSDFEVHDRGTARELKLLRDLARVMADNQEHMLEMNCYAQPVRAKFADLMRFYEEQKYAGYL
jgi:hypothetical protein